MPDGTLKTVTDDLKAARGKSPGQCIQGLLDVPGCELLKLDLTQLLFQRLDGIRVQLLGPVGSAA